MEKIGFVEAIARQEGWLVAGSRAQRNHNPGNIRFGSFAYRHGARSQDDQGFAIFPTDLQGFQALRELLEAHYAGMTLAQAIGKYAPEFENDTGTYIKNVCQMTGQSATHILSAEDFS